MLSDKLSLPWDKSGRMDRFEFEMLDPRDLTKSRGTLTGVVTTGGTITKSNSMDTRTIGTLKLRDSNYIKNSLIRVWHIVDEWELRYPLGTFYVGDISYTYGKGGETASLSLLSTLVNLSDRAYTKHYTINSYTTTGDVIEDIRTESGLEFKVDAMASSGFYLSPVVYDYGTTVLEVLSDTIKRANCRYDVDGYGHVLITQDVDAVNIGAVYTFDPDAPKSPIVGDISITDTTGTAVSTVGVEYASGDVYISGSQTLDNGSEASVAQRGRDVTNIVSTSEMSPALGSEAVRQAGEILAGLSEAATYSFKSLYLPLEPGDVVELVLRGTRHVCTVDTLDNIALEPGLNCTITLKEI